MNNIFRFKQFSVKQNNSVFKVGTDGVILGCLADTSNASFILDIGTGTGLVALICAQRNPTAQITAIDSESEAYTLALENFTNSPFSKQLSAIHCQLQDYTAQQNFDYIICNPPYFKTSEYLHQNHPVARHQLKMDYSLLLQKTNELLAENGKMSCIFPFDDEENVIKIAKKYFLTPTKIIRISGIKNGRIRRTFLELCRNEHSITYEDLYIEENPRSRSENYTKLTRDFYL